MPSSLAMQEIPPHGGILLAEPRCTPVFAIRADFYAELRSIAWSTFAPLAGDALRAAIERSA